jgi:hypothetical protein
MSPLPGICSIADIQEITDMDASLKGRFLPSARTACEDLQSVSRLLLICHFNASRLMSRVTTSKSDLAKSVGRIEWPHPVSSIMLLAFNSELRKIKALVYSIYLDADRPKQYKVALKPFKRTL